MGERIQKNLSAKDQIKTKTLYMATRYNADLFSNY